MITPHITFGLCQHVKPNDFIGLESRKFWQRICNKWPRGRAEGSRSMRRHSTEPGENRRRYADSEEEAFEPRYHDR